MYDQNAIRQRIIDRAIGLFAQQHQGSDDGELFTAAHYAQAEAAEFDTTPLDTEACTGHLKAMAGIENIAGSIWRRLTSDRGRTITKDEAEVGVLRILANKHDKWRSLEILAVALKYDVVLDDKIAADVIRDDGEIMDLVNCALLCMVSSGRVVRHGSMFRIAVNDEKILGDIRHMLD